MFHPSIHGVPSGHGHSHGHDHDDPIILDDEERDDQPYNSDTSTSTSDSMVSSTHRLPAHVVAQQQLSQLQRTQNRPTINPLHQFPTTNGTTLGDATTATETTTTTTMNPNANRPTTTNTHYQTSLEQDKRLRSRIREERHAALCVLLDRELLTVQALAAQESIPQTRRRFLAKLLSPEDPDTAASLQGDRFVIQHPMRLGSVSGGGASRSGTASPAAAAAGASPATPSGGDYDEDDRRLRIGVGIGGPITTTGLIVPRQVEEVYETDEAGWRRPPPGGGAERFGAGGGGGGSGTNRGSPAAAGSSVSSPAGRTKAGTTSNSSSVAATAGSTPDRQRRGIKGRSQRERERERGRARRGLVGGAGAAASIFGASLT